MKYQPGKVQVRLHLYTVPTAHKAKTSKIVLQTSSHIRILWVFPSNSYFHRHWASQKISKETFCLGRSPFREQKPWENHQTCTGGSGQNRYTCHCFKKMWHVSFLPPQNVQSFAVFLGPVKPGRNPPLKPVDTTFFFSPKDMEVDGSDAFPFKKRVIVTLHKTNSKRPWKWMVGIRSRFPLGFRPIFRVRLLVC